MEVYNKNRDKNQSIHDEIREQNAKLKDASLKEKFSYFMEYYLKITIVIVVVILFACYLTYTIMIAPDDTAFAAFFFNDIGDSYDTELIEGFVEYIHLDTKKHDAYIAPMTYSASGTDYDLIISTEKTLAVISTNELDIIVGDADTIDYFASSECFSDITTILPDDLLEQFHDKLYYTCVGESTERIPIGIYVADAPKLKQYQYYVDQEPEPILSFIINSNSLENAIEFLRYIYME